MSRLSTGCPPQHTIHVCYPALRPSTRSLNRRLCNPAPRPPTQDCRRLSSAHDLPLPFPRLPLSLTPTASTLSGCNSPVPLHPVAGRRYLRSSSSRGRSDSRGGRNGESSSSFRTVIPPTSIEVCLYSTLTHTHRFHSLAAIHPSHYIQSQAGGVSAAAAAEATAGGAGTVSL